MGKWGTAKPSQFTKTGRGSNSAHQNKKSVQNDDPGWQSTETANEAVENDETAHVDELPTAEPPVTIEKLDKVEEKMAEIDRKMEILQELSNKIHEVVQENNLKISLMAGHAKEQGDQLKKIFDWCNKEDGRHPPAAQVVQQPAIPTNTSTMQMQNASSSSGGQAWAWEPRQAFMTRQQTPPRTPRQSRKERNEKSRSGSVPANPEDAAERATQQQHQEHIAQVQALIPQPPPPSCRWHGRGNLVSKKFIPAWMGNPKTEAAWQDGGHFSHMAATVLTRFAEVQDPFWNKICSVFDHDRGEIWYDKKDNYRHFTIRCKDCESGCSLQYFKNRVELGSQAVNDQTRQLLSFLRISSPSQGEV